MNIIFDFLVISVILFWCLYPFFNGLRGIFYRKAYRLLKMENAVGHLQLLYVKKDYKKIELLYNQIEEGLVETKKVLMLKELLYQLKLDLNNKDYYTKTPQQVARREAKIIIKGDVND